MLTSEQLAEIQEKYKIATNEARWIYIMTDENVQHIEKSLDDIPALLADLDALREERDRMKAENDKLMGAINRVRSCSHCQYIYTDTINYPCSECNMVAKQHFTFDIPLPPAEQEAHK